MKYFKRHEFACQCGCGFDTVDFELGEVLDEVREHFNASTTINSGARCVKHNAKEGGGTNSQHLFGKASDIVVDGVHADDVADYLESKYPFRYGIGRYNGRTHVDVRVNKTRWDRRS